MFPPEYELSAYRVLADTLQGDSFRFDPNAVSSTEQAVGFGRAIKGMNDDYLEDPVFVLNGMLRTRDKLYLSLATNTVVVNLEQLAANLLHPPVDGILLDTTFWGGIRACVEAAGICETFQPGVCVDSSGGHSACDNVASGCRAADLTFAADAHYHHLVDDVIDGGKFELTRTGQYEYPAA